MFSDTESKEFRASVALELLRYKMKQEVSKNPKYPGLALNDVNECLIVAGEPIVRVEEDLDVIIPEKEDADE